MKDVKLQAAVDEETPDQTTQVEMPDYRDQLTTKPLKPPPDVFLRLRSGFCSIV